MTGSRDKSPARAAGLDDLKDTFGNRRVGQAERRQFVNTLFDDIAPRYDLMNDLMSFGLHRFWKSAMARQAAAALPPSGTLVDLAGGTGDIALAVKALAPAATFTIADASAGMLAQARKRAGKDIVLLHAEAESLPLEKNSVDVVTLAFGLRNMTDPAAALVESFRVLKPGGQLLVLEFSKPQSWFAPFYGVFSRFVIPMLGAIVAANRDAYQYLVESIRLFPDAQSITRELERAGYRDVHVRRFVFGVAALHGAHKPAEGSA